MIHAEMQKTGQVDHRERNVRVQVARQEITDADRQWAEQYEPGNIVRYMKGSKTHGIEAGENSCVESVNARANLLTVRRESGEKISYDPRRLQGVTLYREAERTFSKGDRVQFTVPTGSSTLRIVNWEPSRGSKRTAICNCAWIQAGVSHST